MRILICLAIAMSVATVAHADDMPHLSLHYFSHDDDCPSRQRIADATAARVGHGFRWDDSSLTAITVSMLPAWPDAFTAVVTATDRSQRTFREATCSALELPVIGLLTDLVQTSMSKPPPPDVPTATLRMRTVDGRALNVERVISTEWRYRNHGHWQEPTATQRLCTTPCVATVPVGEALFRLTDVASHGDVQIATTRVSTDGVLDIDYKSNAPTRRRMIRNLSIGAVVGAILGAGAVALAMRGHSDALENDLLTSWVGVIGGFLGGSMGVAATDGRWNDQATLTVRADGT